MFFRKRDKKPSILSPKPAGGIPSIIAANMTVKGDFISTGTLEIDGSIEGNVQCRTVSVRRGGSLQGNVTADEVHLDGKADGMIKGKNIYVANGASVSGILYYDTLTVRDGAALNAQCRNLSELKNADPLGAGAPDGKMFEEMTLTQDFDADSEGRDVFGSPGGRSAERMDEEENAMTASEAESAADAAEASKSKPDFFSSAERKVAPETAEKIHETA